LAIAAKLRFSSFKENKLNKKLIHKLIEEIKTIDVKKDQVTLKITIFDTNLNKLREIGINPNLNFDFDVLTRAGALITGSAVNTFKGSLKFLQTSGATKVDQSTSYLISDAEQLDFKKVVSIPFLDENYVVSNTTGSTNQSKKYKYKEIGFKVLVTPTIVGDIVYLDFNLTVGNVVTSGELPTTSENSITNKFSVKKGDIVLLAGISKSSLINTTAGSPLLESIPILRDIFTQKSDSNIDETFNVSIEILGDTNVETLFSRI
jgi:type II secretory pathway component GspD/PulD (secretin)